ncbi:MAG: ribosome recycling factor [Firmicutes bacterium HGW-Firmicutes-1]|jgi:ribosome recycling factor|nr:MAG: ribosome recycling factor [Firmicutes bacterium HGW-Firmicutes-1]
MKKELEIYKVKMEKTVLSLESEYNTLRAGRANPHILDKLMVDYYGQPTPVQQVGNISIPEPRLMQVQPWDKGLLKSIEKAILMSDIGINPTNDGISIRLVFPELTEERRKDLTKDVKKKGEESKVAIRNIRRDGMDHFKKLEKSHELSEDDLKTLEEDLQKLTDNFIKDIDKHVEEKIKDILTV